LKLAKIILYMDDPEEKNQNLLLADISPKMLLIGENPRLIDEWQLAPQLWDAFRFEADHRDELSQFILTGSAVPAKSDDVHHSGTGRYAWLTMRPMSLFESGESTGEISLKELFSSLVQISALNSLKIDDIAFLICRGGWPRATELKGDIALDQAKDYYDAVTKTDISIVDGVSRNPERVKRLMRSFARHQGTPVSIDTISADMLTNDSESSATMLIHPSQLQP
jgi:hypothetical protein